MACKTGDPFETWKISGPTTIDSQGRDFTFEKPFKPKKQVIKVCIDYSDDLTVDSISEPPQFEDGVKLNLTAKLIDQNGTQYIADQIANSSKNYLCIRPELTNEWMNISKSKVSFSKIVLFSNRNITVNKIEWVGFNTWDI